jgi:Mrp family chromosome partitioning ATPase
MLMRLPPPCCPLQLSASAKATVVALDADYRPRRITKEFVAAVMAGRPMGTSGSRSLAPEGQAAGEHEDEAAAGGEAAERRQEQQRRRQLSRDM